MVKSVSMQRASNRQWVLKPIDLAMLFMLFLARNKPRQTYAAMAKAMYLSQFEAHASVKRLIAAGLLVELEGALKPVMHAVQDFVLHGANYCYPAVRGEVTIGFVTAYGAPPLSEKILFSQELPPVWPHPAGDKQGMSLLPLYEKLPLAAKENSKLYELLALFDALRIGQVREKELARNMLSDRLQ